VRRWRSATALRQGLRPGLISVIVPCYNVERYVTDALASILDQDYRKLDVLVIDDDSTDETLPRIREVAKHDKRVRVFEQAHQGVNAARNAALRHVRGEYVTFLDGDDILVPGAYSEMVRALRAYGTDFVVGRYDRIRDGSVEPAATWIRQAHRKLHRRATVHTFPQIMVNVVAWSKLYRTDFWRRSVDQFGVDGHRQDQPVSARAYAGATSFTVLARPVVHWRVRSDGTSMTQQLFDLDSIHQRFVRGREAIDIYRRFAGDDIADTRFAQYLNHDIAEVATRLEAASNEVWAAFRDGLRDFVATASGEVWDQVHARHRVYYHLIMSDQRPLATAFRAGVADVKVVEDFIEVDGSYYVRYPFWDDAEHQVPRCLYMASTAEKARIRKTISSASSG